MTEIHVTLAEENPDRRKYGYQTLETKLTNHSIYIEKRLRRFFFKALLAFAIIGITSAGALFGFGFVLKEIQHQRYNTIYQNCKQQNQRHDNAIRKGNTIFPPQAKKIVALMVNELQPYVKDCSSFANRRVKGNR